MVYLKYSNTLAVTLLCVKGELLISLIEMQLLCGRAVRKDLTEIKHLFSMSVLVKNMQNINHETAELQEQDRTEMSEVRRVSSFWFYSVCLSTITRSNVEPVVVFPSCAHRSSSWNRKTRAWRKEELPQHPALHPTPPPVLLMENSFASRLKTPPFRRRWKVCFIFSQLWRVGGRYSTFSVWWETF